jgi:hypothetical protein
MLYVQTEHYIYFLAFMNKVENGFIEKKCIIINERMRVVSR